MKVAYCKPCKEIIGAGNLPTAVKVKDKDVPCRYTHHTEDGEHEGKLIEVPDDPLRFGERPAAYHERLLKTYGEKLNA